MAHHHPLKSYRERHGYTQTALAKELGVSSITVSRWETGARKIDPDLVPSVAEKTGLRPKELRPDLAEVFETGAAQ